MNKYKIFIISLLVLLLTGCGPTKKNSLSNDDFVSKISDTDYTLIDVSDNYDYAENAYLVTTDDVHIEFIIMNNVNDATGNYVDEVENVVKTLDNINYEKKNGENWNSFEVTTDKKYYYIEYVGRTYLYVESSIDYKDSVKELIKELNY